METLQTAVNVLFDRLKAQHQLPSDAALARHMGVSEMAILRWRRGEYAPSLKIIGPHLIEHAENLRKPAA